MSELGEVLLADDATAAFARADYAAAEALCRRALAKGEDPELLAILAASLHQQRRQDEAETAYRRSLELRPDDALTLHNYGKLLRRLRRPEEAEAAQARAIALRPDLADAYLELGLIRLRAFRFEEAAAVLRRATVLAPVMADAWHHLGVVTQALGLADEAEECFRRAISTSGDPARSHMSLGIVLLQMGRWEEGWREFEWRWQWPGLTDRRHQRSAPRWDGGRFDAKTLLLHAEQGLGDTLHFARYLPRVKALGGTVILECQPGLGHLLARCAGIDGVVERGAAAPPHDLQLPLMSLPHVLGLHPPLAAPPYLHTDPERRRRWAERLGDAPGLKVGLVWRGNPKHANDRNRSVPAEAMAPLARLPGLRLFALQKDATPAECAALPGIRALGPDLTDMAETAAAIANLDLVVTVDTAVAHLAGGLGRATYLLLPFVPDWRWGTNGETTPWYDSVRLFRQPTAGDWTPVLEDLETAVRDRAALPAGPERYTAARAATASGDRSLAQRLFHGIARLDPTDIHALHMLALTLPEQEPGACETAEALLRRAARFAPASADLRHALAHRLSVLGRVTEAEQALAEAVALRPDRAEFLVERAQLLSALGRRNEAEACYRAAAERRADFFEAQANLAHLLLARDQLAEADQRYRMALALRPDHPEILAGLATLADRAGRADEALALRQRAVAADPANVAALNNLGNALLKAKNPTEAADAYRRALAVAPESAESHYNLSDALSALGRYPEAEASVRQAIALRPDWGLAWGALGHYLDRQLRFAEAEEASIEALRHDPTLWQVTHNVALAAQRRGELDRALEYYRRSIAARPNYAKAQFGLATTLLLKGEFEDGWRIYEWRWRMPDFPDLGRKVDAPRWDGGRFDGKTLLVHAEQGLGDTLQFVRYLPLVKRLGGRVLLQCQEPLPRLLAMVAGADEVVPRGAPLPAHEAQIPLLSLPFVLGLPEPLPATPYLGAEAKVQRAWRKRLGNEPGLKIGLCWRGNPKHANDHIRSLPAGAMAPLAEIPGVRLFALQKDARPDELAAIPGITPLGEHLHDMAETAGAIAALDLVISVDTSVAHLAAAIGRATYLLLQHVPDWRWGLTGESTPWYDSVRLFRQPTLDDWHPVLAEVEAVLRTRAGLSAEARTRLREEGFQALGAGRLDQADRAARQLAADPADAQAQHLLGLVAHERQDHATARSTLARASRLAPDDAGIHNNLGNAQQALARWDEAEASYRRAIALAPAVADLHRDLAVLLSQLDRLDEAAEAWRIVVRLNPDAAIAHYQLGVIARAGNRLDEAIGHYEAAIAADPEHAGAHMSLGLALLAAGRFEAGWRECEWRWCMPDLPDRALTPGCPRWDGSPFPGKTLLVQAEQGIGDTLQFLRYLPELRRLGGRVVLACQEALVRLLAPLDLADAVVARGTPVDCDLHLPMMSLPLALGHYPPLAAAPYVRPPAELAKVWRNRVGPAGLKIGLCWRGNPRHHNDARRSMSAAALAPLARMPGVRLFNLQKGASAEELASLPGIVDLAAGFEDLADTAAAIEALDLVVSVDTAIAHLAGSMGRRGMVLLPFSPDWRWGLEGPDNDWYGSLTLLRQNRPGEWDEIVTSVVQTLKTMAPAQTATPRRSNTGRTPAKRVCVLSYNNVGNFGDRLGYHLIHQVLPPDAIVRHCHFRPWDVPEDEAFDLVVLGIGNSLFGPLLEPRLERLLERAKASIGIFGTQYRKELPRARLDAVLDRLDLWHARYRDDIELFGGGRANIRHLGDWLIGAFPMAEGTRDEVLRIGPEVTRELPLDRLIQQIQAHRRVVSTRLHPLLCALTSAEQVAYEEQREMGAAAGESGKFGSMLRDVFGRSFPESQLWSVDRAAVAAYKATIKANMAKLEADIARLLQA